MYDATEKVALLEREDVAALLDCNVVVDGKQSPLRAVLTGDSTILLFVRNGA